MRSQRQSWAYRFALCAAVSAVPLVLFGGSVTTLGAGMAVEGWLIAEGHFMLLFPLDQWFRDTATFVEHTHRLFGALVGMFAVAAVIASFLPGRSPHTRGARTLSAAALLAVCAQGTLGGFRVLENDPELAFLHGASAQAVFALLCASALVLHRGWRQGAGSPQRAGGGPRVLAFTTMLLVYGQIVLGAWYRHALRPTPSDEAGARFAWHLFAALAVAIFVVALITVCRRLDGALFRRSARRLGWVLSLQVLLGVVAWVGYRPGAVGVLEWGLSILHVLGGGLLLTQTIFIWMWMERSRMTARTEEEAIAPSASVLVPREAH